jgi:hypothetical protein
MLLAAERKIVRQITSNSRICPQFHSFSSDGDATIVRQTQEDARMSSVIADDRGPAGNNTKLSVAMALRTAWVAWVALLVTPMLVSLALIWRLFIVPSSGASESGRWWFLAATLYLLVVVPCSFFWRNHVFKAYWTGKPVAPQKYLAGMLTIWGALVVGGIFSLVGCFVSGSLMPSIMPALLAFIFFITQWPSGRAMIGTVGDHEDPETYEEPR